MSQVDIRIIGDDGKTRWFREHTPLAEAQKKASQSGGLLRDTFPDLRARFPRSPRTFYSLSLITY